MPSSLALGCSRDLAARINGLMADPAQRQRFGKAWRKRAEEKFSWAASARQVQGLYESLVQKRPASASVVLY